MTKEIYCCLCLLVLVGCGLSDEEFVQLATDEYQRKAKLLRQEQAQLCYNKIIVIAERQADSIIRQMRINPLRDALYRPNVPFKPDFISVDSSVFNSKETVKPILDSAAFKR